jgi:tryptophanyl-tRNA synthetase
MTPAGHLHLGHYWGALTNWRKLQYQYGCFFMVADINHLIDDFHPNESLQDTISAMVIEWLASGIDPSQATIFLQSKIPEIFELTTLLSAITPLGWLERVPDYKDRIETLDHTESSTYGLLGSPLLQASAMLIYDATLVSAPEEDVAYVELTRELARRFNHLFGREEGFEARALESIKKLGKKKAEIYTQLLIKYQQDGDDEALDKARYLLQDALNLVHSDRERLFAFLENKGQVFLNEPQVLPEEPLHIIGLDGQKMSAKANNCIYLRDSITAVAEKIRGMTTDPARVRRSDKGNPEACPVWTLHKVYSTQDVKDWVELGCLSGGIGCLDCKAPLIDEINSQQSKLQEKAKPYQEDITLVKRIIMDGCLRARDVASENLKQIRQAMEIDY